jgi:Leucine-rich repeat (LRR) protein
LTALPDDIQKLVALKELFLSRNEFASLPSTFVNLKNLEKLTLARNHFTLEALKPLQSLPKLSSLAINVNSFDSSKFEAPFDSREDIQAFFKSISS